jgi:citrate lyase beta subunit
LARLERRREERAVAGANGVTLVHPPQISDIAT